LDPPSWISLLLKKKTEINAKSSQNAFEMYKFVNFYKLIKKTEKNTEIIIIMLIFGQNYMKFDGCHDNVKNDRRTIDMSKFLQRMNEQLLNVSAL